MSSLERSYEGHCSDELDWPDVWLKPLPSDRRGTELEEVSLSAERISPEWQSNSQRFAKRGKNGAKLWSMIHKTRARRLRTYGRERQEKGQKAHIERARQIPDSPLKSRQRRQLTAGQSRSSKPMSATAKIPEE